jgi:hypothetical protein
MVDGTGGEVGVEEAMKAMMQVRRRSRGESEEGSWRTKKPVLDRSLTP